MAIACMVMGSSGSGKSASLRNFTKDEVTVINVAGKPLPFKTDIKTIKTDDYTTVLARLVEAKTKAIVIDDAQYLMANEFMRRSDEKGFQKFTDIGKNFWNLVNNVSLMNENQIVYFLQHTELDANGDEKAKTIGKLLDEKITLEGLFSIVLKAQVSDGRYVFQTQTNGTDTAKSPMGMFETKEIDNDLKLVDNAIRNFYDLKGATK